MGVNDQRPPFPRTTGLLIPESIDALALDHGLPSTALLNWATGVDSAIGSGGGGTGGLSYTFNITLTAASTLITSPVVPADGDRGFLRLAQDATGGRLITWDSIFVGVSPEMNDLTALSAGHFLFWGLGGKWLLVAYPLLGVL